MVYWPIYRKSALQKFSLFFGQSSSRKIFFRKFENFGLTVSSFELPYHTARLSFKDFWPTDWKQKASQQDIMIIIWRPKFMVCIMNHHKIWPNNWRKNQKATHHQLYRKFYGLKISTKRWKMEGKKNDPRNRLVDEQALDWSKLSKFIWMTVQHIHIWIIWIKMKSLAGERNTWD
jgi:hypothetical protein